MLDPFMLYGTQSVPVTVNNQIAPHNMAPLKMFEIPDPILGLSRTVSDKWCQSPEVFST